MLVGTEFLFDWSRERRFQVPLRLDSTGQRILKGTMEYDGGGLP